MRQTTSQTRQLITLHHIVPHRAEHRTRETHRKKTQLTEILPKTPIEPKVFFAPPHTHTPSMTMTEVEKT